MLFLDFEDSIAELEAELADLRHSGGDANADERSLQARIMRQMESIYGRLTPWQTIQVARHPERPGAREIIHNICSHFIELHGDRDGGDALFTTGGIARVMDHSVVIIGHDKPRQDAEAKPPRVVSDLACGLKKTARLLSLAERFRLPVVLIADGEPTTSNDIALPLHNCMNIALNLRVPIISVISGSLSGPSTALLMSADAVLMLSHATLSPVSPEDSAMALWPDTTDSARATIATSDALHLISADLRQQSVVDAVITEPAGGAHRYPKETSRSIGASVLAHLESLRHMEGGLLRAKRRDRLTSFGRVSTTSS